MTKVIGGVVLVLWLLGVLDILDFHICIASAGQCNVTLNYGAETMPLPGITYAAPRYQERT